MTFTGVFKFLGFRTLRVSKGTLLISLCFPFVSLVAETFTEFVFYCHYNKYIQIIYIIKNNRGLNPSCAGPTRTWPVCLGTTRDFCYKYSSQPETKLSYANLVVYSFFSLTIPFSPDGLINNLFTAKTNVMSGKNIPRFWIFHSRNPLDQQRKQKQTQASN